MDVKMQQLWQVLLSHVAFVYLSFLMKKEELIYSTLLGIIVRD